MFRNRPLLTYDIAMWFCSNGMATSFNRDMDFWFATFCLNTPTIISNSFPGVKDGIYDETKCVIQQNANRWTDMWGKRNAYHIWNIRSSKIVAVPLRHTQLSNLQHMSPKSQAPGQRTHRWQHPSRKSQGSCSQWVYAPSMSDGRSQFERDHPEYLLWKKSSTCNRKCSSNSEKERKCIDRLRRNPVYSRQKRPCIEWFCGHCMEESKWSGSHSGFQYRR